MARNKKHINDKFYSKKELVSKLISYIDLSIYDLIIEPSAGSGSFSDQISSSNLEALDIDPENDNIKKMDWFDYKLPKEYKKILVIGNPPFGNQGSLAIKFIRKAIDLKVDTIAFILPKSFKKDSMKSKIPLNYHLVKEVDIEDDSFTLNGVSYSVPCIFQIWRKMDYNREEIVYEIKSELFNFVKKNESPDFSFRRVGFYAGKIYDDIDNKSEQSHYFIKSIVDLEYLKNILININWEHNNTAGPRSIGKRELIYEINKIIE